MLQFRQRFGSVGTAVGDQGQEHSQGFGLAQRFEIYEVEDDQVRDTDCARQRVYFDSGAGAEERGEGRGRGVI